MCLLYNEILATKSLKPMTLKRHLNNTLSLSCSVKVAVERKSFKKAIDVAK